MYDKDLEDRINSMDKRLTLVEVGQSNLQKISGDSYALILSIKEKLDKQNGMLPQLSKNVDEMWELISDVKNRQMIQKNKSDILLLKTKVIWGVGGIIITSALGLIMYMIRTRLGS